MMILDNARKAIEDAENEYDKVESKYVSRIAELMDQVEEKDQRIAELENQINNIPTKPTYTG